MRVIVVGCGRVGSELAITLQRDGHQVVVLDKNRVAFRRLPDDWAGETVVGFGFERDDLERAGIRKTDALAAVTSGDNTNILTARIARENFEVPSVVARIYDPRRALIYQRLGIPTVGTVSWSVDQMIRRLLPDEAVTAWTDPTGQVNMAEHPLPDRFAGHSLAELTNGDRFRPIMVTRGGQARVALPTAIGQAGDVVLFCVRTDAIDELRRLLAPQPAGMKVAIAGAGVVGTSIANDLCEAGHEVLVIEADIQLVESHRTGMSCTWFAGDACEVTVLDEAGLADVDVVVAATGDDEDNLVISLLAKQEFAVPRVIARVNHPANRWLFNETWGVDVSVSTPHLMTALVEEAVSVGTLVRLFHFAEGQARLVEVTLAASSPALDKPIAELGMPRDASIVAVIRDRRVVVPRGDTVLQGGDEVIALVTEDSEDPVRAILVASSAS